MLERRFLERMPRPRRVEQIAGEHRIELEAPRARCRDAASTMSVELQIVADLPDRRVLEQRT